MDPHKQTSLKLDLDQQLDLSTYCPEKALHLELEQPHNNAVQQIDDQIQQNEKARIEFIRQKIDKTGLNRKKIAKMAFQHFPERKDFSKFCQNIYTFLDTGKGEAKIIEVLSHIFKTPEQYNQTIDYNKFQLKHLRDFGITAFKESFPLIWKYREGICNTPELSNITNDELGYGASFAGFAKIPLGALLIKYNNGLLRCEMCQSCQCPTLGYYSARGLSGAGFHHAFCPNCGQDYRKLNSRLDDLYKDPKQLCPTIDTNWTLHDLILALRRLENKA